MRPSGQVASDDSMPCAWLKLRGSGRSSPDGARYRTGLQGTG